MHALYKRKKTLLLVALCCMNSVGSFISATKALPTEKTSEDYQMPSLEKLHPKIQTIVKGKEKEYGKLLAYYQYKLSWNMVYMGMGLSLFCAAIESFLLGITISYLTKLRKDGLLNIAIFFNIYFLCAIFISVFRSIARYKEAKYPGAIFLTDRGVLFIDCGYNVKHEFIPYTDIKQVKLQKLSWLLEIEFFKNFSDSKGKDIEYSDKVNKITISKSYTQNGAKGTNPHKDLYKTLSEIVEKVRTGEKAKQKST